MTTRLEELYQKEVESIRELDAGVWSAANKRGQPPKEKKAKKPRNKTPTA